MLNHSQRHFLKWTQYFRYVVVAKYRLSQDAEYAGIDNSFGKNTTTTQFCSIIPELKYQRGKLTLNTTGEVSWSKNHRKDVLSAAANDINIYNYRFSLSGTYELPWQLQVSSTFEMMFNRSYENDYLDTDRMMWNMSLSRPFMKGKLLARIVANDILGQYSNHSISLSSSGYSERWTNGLGRYVMLSLAYKLDFILRFLAMAMIEQAHHCSSGLTKTFNKMKKK